MNDLICPFGVTLVQHDFGCQYAIEIVRRGGAEAACQNHEKHNLCSALYQQLKVTALEAMELEDDLLTLPHSVLVKIQYGGLLGLQQSVFETTEDIVKVEDISSLVNSAMEQFSSLDKMPYFHTSKVISQFKLARRGRKKQ